MTSATPQATLFLQVFDEHDDRDKLIGNTEIKLEQYVAENDDTSANGAASAKLDPQWLALTHPKKRSSAGSTRGEIRVGVSFVRRDLGPSAMRSLNSTLTRMMEAPTWGLVNLLRPAMVELYKDMIMSRDEDDEANSRPLEHRQATAHHLSPMTRALDPNKGK